MGDETYNQEMANLVMKQGTPGGMERRLKEPIGQEQPQQQASRWEDQLDENEGDWEDLTEWLNNDENYDEGTVMVMGRTHFFTGELRLYVGMPATSARDFKDRNSGGGMNGAERRKRSVVYTKNLVEGDYGNR